jgi:hypothetical protein
VRSRAVRHRWAGLAETTVGLIAAAFIQYVAASTVAHAAPPAAESRSMQRQVVQAGGPIGEAGDVKKCGFGHHDGGRLCHGGCREGGCPTHCPVRPHTFGFYGTQWRAWPTQGVAETRDARASMPVPPATSAVPGIEEESLKPAEETRPADELPIPERSPAQAPPQAPPQAPAPPQLPPADADTDAEPQRGGPAGRDVLDDLPPVDPAPSKPSPAEEASPDAQPDGADPAPPAEEPKNPEPALEPIPERKPEGGPDENPQAKPDENIFDEAGRSRRRSELFAVMRHRAAAIPARAGDPSTGTIGLASHPEPVPPHVSPDRMAHAGGAEPLPAARGLRNPAVRPSGGNPLRPGRVTE